MADMRLRQAGAEIFVPDGVSVERALRRAAQVGVVAHPDDLEILAFPGILESYRKGRRGFFGIVVTDGAGSSRGGAYRGVSNLRMARIRRAEQKEAAVLGRYSGVALLDYSSDQAKRRGPEIAGEIAALLRLARPSVVYTHNPADKHATHVAVALKTIRALRSLPRGRRPKSFYGCEVWRDLDWLADEEKVVLDVSGGEKLAGRLLKVFDSQNAGGKRYDLATQGRRRANATYHASHAIERPTACIFALDLRPLLRGRCGAGAFLAARLRSFERDVLAQIRRLDG